MKTTNAGNDFYAARAKYLKNDGKIDAAEAQSLNDFATERVSKAVNPSPTLDKYDAEMRKLIPLAADDNAAAMLRNFKQFDGNTEVQLRAAQALQHKVMTTPQDKLPFPMDAIAKDKDKGYDVLNMDGGPTGETNGMIPGGVDISDDASDGYYIQVPIDVTKLGQGFPVTEGSADKLARQLERDMAKDPELKHHAFFNNVTLQVIFVQPQAQ